MERRTNTINGLFASADILSMKALSLVTPRDHPHMLCGLRTLHSKFSRTSNLNGEREWWSEVRTWMSAEEVWSGTGISTTTLVAASLLLKVLLMRRLTYAHGHTGRSDHRGMLMGGPAILTSREALSLMTNGMKSEIEIDR